MQEYAWSPDVPDVPDLSAEWYLDLAGLGAASPEPLRAFVAFATEAVLGVFAVLFVVLWWRARSGGVAVMARAVLAPVVTVLAYAVSETVKGLWEQDRPCRVLGDVATAVACPELGDWSFPSNHATIAGAAAVAVLWSSRALGGFAAGVAVLAAASRVVAGVHYPHDVLAGLLLGAVVAASLPVAARILAPAVSRLRGTTAGGALLGHGPWEHDGPTVVPPRAGSERPMPTARAMALWAGTALPVVLAALTTRPGRLAPWEAAGYLVVLAVAVLVVRRRPAGALVLITAAWQVGFLSRAESDSALGLLTLAQGLVALGFLAGRHAAAPQRGVVVLVVAMAGAVVGALVATGGADTVLATLAGTALFAVVPWSVGRYRRRFAELVRAGWDRAEWLEREAEQARMRERTRLAAEMHDLVGHELARAALRVGALEVAPTLPAEHRDAARAARSGVTAAAERLADVVRLLRAELDEPVETVAEVVERARRSGLRAELAGDVDEAPADPVIARTVHRVVTEAITNAVKHAPGAAVTVRLARSAGGLDLVVRNGPAAEPPRDVVGGGNGLVGLAERVTLVGGRFAAEPRADGGFEVTAHLPARAVTAAAPALVTRERRRRVERQVRHSARRTVLLTLGVSAGIVVSALGYRVFDAATSVLAPADYARLRLGQPESEVAAVLPVHTRVDAPGGVPPAPPRSSCRYYSTHPNPFDGRRDDLYRLCFRDGRLVDKALLVRDP
ncbi:Signal transduction histidine kinase [Amycolatopsis arida]|uniref:histidine kinase n=1 Tax=Amycolatopsis arida TaxID=587909 RepID=A0A1I5SYV2_9PSEU|nr:phosphatase PAP2 family protein [Amycolatopsis arida]TDX96305.1 signal transduction histidine kinase [Amycolatopsis arida]SFP75617.1 Signal transduction histidine kinase [Amycolatopsis arida]